MTASLPLKPFKSIADQISLLQSRNMQFPDESRAAVVLQEIGYYRLSQYSYNFRDNSGTGNFLIDTTFDQVEALYRFDEHLRELLYSMMFRSFCGHSFFLVLLLVMLCFFRNRWGFDILGYCVVLWCCIGVLSSALFAL